jgi:hypothetical protein
MALILFPEFRDQHRPAWYPFADDTALVTPAGLVITQETILDASVYPIGGSARMRLGAVVVAADTVTFVIKDTAGTSMAFGEFQKLDPPAVVELLDALGRPAGAIVCDPVLLATFQTWDVGTHDFGRGIAEFVASVTVPTPEIGLRGILTEDGDLLTGDVWIVGDAGIAVHQEDGFIRIDIVGDPLFIRRLCQPFELFTTPHFIETINGIAPDEYGNFAITVTNSQAVDTALRIYPVNESTLRVSVVGSTVERG